MSLPPGLSWPDPDAWCLALSALPIPALAETTDELAVLALIEERRGCMDARSIAKAIVNDPLMTARVLADAARLRHPGQISDAETVTAAVLMMGTGRFFSTLSQITTVEHLLQEHPDVADFLRELIRHSHRAALLTVGVALHRADDDAEAMQEAAMLQDLATMLLCCRAPAMMQPWVHQSASLAEQDEALQGLNLQLLRQWSMPDVLIRLSDDHAPAQALIQPQRRVVQLCRQLAHCTASGWPTLQLNALGQPAFLHSVEATPELPALEPVVPSEATARTYHQKLLPALAELMGLSPIAADHHLRELES
jgi:HD-like signal output (HDOD) protein